MNLIRMKYDIEEIRFIVTYILLSNSTPIVAKT